MEQPDVRYPSTERRSLDRKASMVYNPSQSMVPCPAIYSVVTMAVIVSPVSIPVRRMHHPGRTRASLRQTLKEGNEDGQARK